MPDPRLAPLAAALAKSSFYPYRSGVDYGAGRPIEWEYLHEQERASLLADAAAILAALSDDWCGHGWKADYRGLTVYPWTNADYEGIQAELARLRKIEEAARKFMDQEVSWIGDRPYYVYAGRPPIGTMDALRAALEADHA